MRCARHELGVEEHRMGGVCWCSSTPSSSCGAWSMVEIEATEVYRPEPRFERRPDLVDVVLRCEHGSQFPGDDLGQSVSRGAGLCR